MLHIKSFTFNPFQENTYLIYDEDKYGVLIDPGCFESNEKQELLDFVAREKIQIKQLVNTHCHIDHVLGNAWAKKTFSIPLAIHTNEKSVLKAVEVYAPNYGFVGYKGAEPDSFLTEGTNLTVGKENLKILFVPGHSPGHVVFYHQGSGKAIAGDTLFRGSIGRTDLPGGNQDLLLKKIKEVLFSLPEDTIIYPGHGSETTIGFEKENNPFVGKNALY